MKYIEDNEDLEFPYCKNNNDNDNNELSNQDKPNTSCKKKYLYIIIIILCIIIVGLSIFLIVYFTTKKDKVEIIINNINNPQKENYIIAKYLINSNDITNLFHIPENSSNPNFEVKDANEGRILQEDNNILYNENNTYFYNADNSSEIKDLTIKIKIDKALISISKMFQNCENLVEINFTNFSSNNITRMESTFLNCTSLRSVDFTNFDSSYIKTMNSAFENCISLTELNLSSFKTTNLETMNSMFKNCRNLSLLNLSNFELNQNVNVSDSFLNLDNLQILITKDSSILGNISKDDIEPDLNISCFKGENDSEEENKKFICGECNDGYTFFKAQKPTNCEKVCFIENFDRYKNDFVCEECIDGYNLFFLSNIYFNIKEIEKIIFLIIYNS